MAKIFMRLSLVAVFGALVLIYLLQNQWFTRSAAGEISRAHRNISMTILRTAGQEFQKYSLILLDPFLRTSQSPKDGESKNSLEKIYNSFGPEGEIPGLILYTGFFTREEPESLWIYNHQGWQKTGNSLSGSLEPLLSDDPGRDRMIYQMSGRDLPQGSPVLVVSKDPEKRLFFILGLDTEGFFNRHVKPAVAEALPEYDFTWRETSGETWFQETPPDPSFREETYRFSPIKILFRNNTDRTKEFSLPIPRFVLSGMDRTAFAGILPPGVEAPETPEGNPSPAPERDRRFSFYLLGDPERDNRRYSPEIYAYLDVFPKEGSVVFSTERRLVFSWLAGTILLFLVGFGYLFLILQMERLKALRTREREFVASITHELRTPVSVIQSAADNLSAGIVSPERMATYGSLLTEQTRRLGGMIEEVLLFSKLQNGQDRRDTLKRAEISLEDLLRELKEYIEPILKSSNNLRITWELNSLPRRAVTDPESLAVILRNLLLNALIHAYPGEKTGVIRVAGWLRIPGTLVFTIEDEGLGIPASESKRLFEPFYRTRYSRENQEKGSGLGLFIARKKAEALGGRLKLESPYLGPEGREKKGCRFILEIPYSAGKGGEDR